MDQNAEGKEAAHGRLFEEILLLYLFRREKEKELSTTLRQQNADRVLEFFSEFPRVKTPDALDSEKDDIEFRLLSELFHTAPEGSIDVREIVNRVVRDPIERERAFAVFFCFEDIEFLEDRHIQKILREAEDMDIIKALKGAPESLKRRLFSNLSQDDANDIVDSMEYIGPVRKKDVDTARSRILRIVRELEANGQIVVPERNEENRLIW